MPTGSLVTGRWSSRIHASDGSLDFFFQHLDIFADAVDLCAECAVIDPADPSFRIQQDEVFGMQEFVACEVITDRVPCEILLSGKPDEGRLPPPPAR